MIISILCVDNKFGIGKNNNLLFHLKKDMEFFRNTTKGHMVFMGENTLLSFPNHKPLPGRINVVLSQDPTHNYEGCENVHNFEEFVKILKKNGGFSDVFVIGGASIYRQTLPYVDKVLLTKVNADGGATLFFPNLDEMDEWKCTQMSEPTIDEGFEIRFLTYERK